MIHPYRYLDRRTVTTGSKDEFGCFLALIIVKFFLNGSTADYYRLRGINMSMNRDYCV